MSQHDDPLAPHADARPLTPLNRAIDGLRRLSLDLRTLDLDKVLRRIIRKTPAIFGSRRCALYVPDHDGGRIGWRVRTTACEAPAFPSRCANDPMQRALDTGRPVIAPERGPCLGAPDGVECGQGCIVVPLYLYHEELPPADVDTPIPLLCTCGIKDDDLLTGADAEANVALFGDVLSVSIANAVAHAKTERLAYQDSLTSVKTRHVFEELVRSEWTRFQRHESRFCLAIVDVDHLKQINDTHGHLAGDRVLKEVARILDIGTRESDLVVRYGGDEFTILLPETDLDGAACVMRRVTAAIGEADFGLPPGDVHVSVGVASTKDKGAPREMLAAADQALYESKRSGGGIVSVEPTPSAAFPS